MKDPVAGSGSVLIASLDHLCDISLADWGLGGDEIDALIASGVVAQRSASD